MVNASDLREQRLLARHANRSQWIVGIRIAMLAIISVAYAADARAATQPGIAFDIAPIAACRDITPAEFADSHPGEKLVEVKLRISALLNQGDEDDLVQYFYRIESPNATLPVFDFSPQTTLASDMASNVTIEKKDEKNNHLGITFTAPYEFPVKAAGAGDLGTKATDTTRYELVPEMDAIVVAGTMNRGYGVYFKLRPSRGTSLEGAREFGIVFRVPNDWRGGYLLLHCQAVGVHRGPIKPLNETVVAGASRFAVSLYQAGDVEAKRFAENLVRAESNLRQTLSAKQREIEKRSYPTIAHRVGKFFDVVQPKIPRSWAAELVFENQSKAFTQVADQLPADVRQAADSYLAARQQLSQLRAGDHIHLE